MLAGAGPDRSKRSRPWQLALLGLALACGCTESDAPVDTSPEPPRERLPVPDPMQNLSCEGPQPGAAAMRLLTRAEYQNTVRDLLGVPDADVDSLPPENHALGFENNAEAHQASPLLTQRLLLLAEAVAERAVDERLQMLAPCLADWPSDQVLDEAARTCRDTFIQDFGMRAFRRPLRDEEAAIFVEAFGSGLASGGPASAVETVIQVALISPQFLYRINEVAPGEGTAPVRLDGYEVATRLSYFLWSSTPDAALLAAAQSGALDTAEGVEAEARRLLDDERARDTIDSFHRQWLQLDKLESASRDLPHDMPYDDRALLASWRDSLLAFAADALLGRDGSVEMLFTSPVVFVDGVMAHVYGGDTGQLSHEMAVFAADERAGLLTQPALMGLLAHPEQSSPIKRGIFVREQIMCEALPDPPNNIAIEPPDPDPSATTRDRFAQHTEKDECAGCHTLIDPVGFGFEAYDQLGRFRTTENGLEVETDGGVNYPSIDPNLSGTFSDAVELSHRLATSPQVTDCVARQWYRFAMGRGAGAPEDRCNLALLQRRFRETGGDVRELLVGLALSDAFLFRQPSGLPDPRFRPQDEPQDDPTDDPMMTSSPIGHLDGVDSSGVARGWALDPDTPGYPLPIAVAVDGVTIEPLHRADRPRPDVNEATGLAGDHGFVFVVPELARDGKAHVLTFTAVDTGRDSHAVIGKMAFTAGDGTSAPPRGVLDAVSDDGAFFGWAFDPDSPETVLTVELYLDLPSYLGGTPVMTVTTGGERPDVNAVFGLDAAVKAGFSGVLEGIPPGKHVLYAEVIDASQRQLRGFATIGGQTFEVTQGQEPEEQP